MEEYEEKESKPDESNTEIQDARNNFSFKHVERTERAVPWSLSQPKIAHPSTVAPTASHPVPAELRLRR